MPINTTNLCDVSGADKHDRVCNLCDVSDANIRTVYYTKNDNCYMYVKQIFQRSAAI